MLLLGDEACAQGAIDSGISAAYGYPGTPSTEILDYIIKCGCRTPPFAGGWCANEKTAYERAMGVSYAGKRVLVCMKHVGLNVAFDAFVNSALQRINGGLVVAVADDPGMHSSQNEQDTRCLADFAHVICLEPAHHQEAYDMTREAFVLSEKFHLPVVVKLVTRLAHSRSTVMPEAALPESIINRATSRSDWMCIPSCARVNYHALLETQEAIRRWSESSRFNLLNTNSEFTGYGVITSGLGGAYFAEVADRLPVVPTHLHIGAYPVPVALVKQLARQVGHLVVIEEGSPFVEEKLRSIIADPLPISGKLDGVLPPEGELTPDSVAKALGLPLQKGTGLFVDSLPARPPQLCKGCPHNDTFALLRAIRDEFPDVIITSDIGCYTLGALPPYEIIDTALCMGASIGMAAGAADAGYSHVIATIGDSTFLHSGLAGLIDAVASGSNMVIMILDNSTTAMTGGQRTVLDSSHLHDMVAGTGIAKEHLHTIVPLAKNHEANAALLRRELLYKGISVVISKRECAQFGKCTSAGMQ